MEFGWGFQLVYAHLPLSFQHDIDQALLLRVRLDREEHVGVYIYRRDGLLYNLGISQLECLIVFAEDDLEEVGDDRSLEGEQMLSEPF